MTENVPYTKIYRDRRERPKHAGLAAILAKTLTVGDYSVEHDGTAQLVIEHKSPADLYWLVIRDSDRRMRQERLASAFASSETKPAFLIIDEEPAHLAKWSRRSADKALEVGHNETEAKSANFRHRVLYEIYRIITAYFAAGWLIVMKPAGVEWQSGYPLVEDLLVSSAAGTFDPKEELLDRGLQAGREYLDAMAAIGPVLVTPCVRYLLTEEGRAWFHRLYTEGLKPPLSFDREVAKLMYRHFGTSCPDLSNDELAQRVAQWADGTGVSRLSVQFGLALPELQQDRERICRSNGCHFDKTDRHLPAYGLCVNPGQCPYSRRNAGERDPLMAVETCNLRQLPGIGEVLDDVLGLLRFARTVREGESRSVGEWCDLTATPNLIQRQLNHVGYRTLRTRLNMAQDYGLIGSPALTGCSKRRQDPYRLWLPQGLLSYPLDWLHTWFMGLYSGLMRGEVGNFRPRTQFRRLEHNRKRAGRSPSASPKVAAVAAGGRFALWQRQKPGAPIARIIPFLATLIAVESQGNWVDIRNRLDALVSAAKSTLKALSNSTKAKPVRRESWTRASLLFLAVVDQAQSLTPHGLPRFEGAARGTLAHTDVAVPAPVNTASEVLDAGGGR